MKPHQLRAPVPITDLGASRRCSEGGQRCLGQRRAVEWLVQCQGRGSLSFAVPSLPHQDVLCTPARRLLQDSQDIPVTVTPLRAERVLLFDDALVLLQVGWGRPEVLGVVEKRRKETSGWGR